MNTNNITYNNYNAWFFFTLFYLLIDYGRPQDIIPIDFLRPGMISVLILIYFIISTKNLNFSTSKQVKYIWYFVILTAVYVPFVKNNFWAYTTTRTMILYLPFILSAIICVNSIERLRTIINIFVILMIYIAIYSIFHNGVGSGNYFADENDVSLFINMWLPFCYFLFFYEKDKIKKILYATGLIAGLAAIVVSFSRGGFVGLLCVSFVIWLVSPRKIISLVIICIAATAIYLYSGEAYIKEMSTITDTTESTANARLLSWKAAWDMFLDNPFGVGGNNFQIRFPEYQSQEFGRGMWGHVAHSLWFTLLPELGIVGLYIYVRLLYFNVKDIVFIKKINIVGSETKYLYLLSLAFMSSLAGFFASATFLSVLYYPHYWYITALIVVTTKLTTNYTSKKGELVNSNIAFTES